MQNRRRRYLGSLLLILGLMAPVMPQALAQETVKRTAGFLDIPNSHPHYVAITYLAEGGMFNGFSDGTFKSNDTITRAAALKVLLTASGIQASGNQAEAPFSDVPTDVWFTPFVSTAKALGVVKGNDDGSFRPEQHVIKAEFIKMLAEANQLNKALFDETESTYSDVPSDAWFKPYMLYAVRAGLITPDDNGALKPADVLSRGDVAEMLYLFSLTKKGDDTQFLLRRAEVEMAQIEVYITAQKPHLAKKASALAVGLTQQAYANLSNHPVVIGAAKLARAYDWLVDAYILMAQGNHSESAQKANNAIKKASEAWEANKSTQPIARHIKDVAREILKKVGGTEE